MKITKKLFTIGAAFIILGCADSVTTDHTATPRDKINVTVEAILNLIEKGDSQSIITNHVYLTQERSAIYAERKINGTQFDEIPKEQLEILKTILERVLLLEPEFTENGTIATYTSEIFPMPIRFIYIDKQWKIFE